MILVILGILGLIAGAVGVLMEMIERNDEDE